MIVLEERDATDLLPPPLQEIGIEAKIEYTADESPDVSWLGSYQNSWVEGAIDREEAGDYDRGEYRYFLPARHMPHDPKSWAHVSAADKRKVIAEFGSLAEADEAYAMQDYERMEAFNRGDWMMMGIVVTLTLDGKDVGFASLWGVESDASSEYVSEVEDGLLNEAIGDFEQLKARL